MLVPMRKRTAITPRGLSWTDQRRTPRRWAWAAARPRQPRARQISNANSGVELLLGRSLAVAVVGGVALRPGVGDALAVRVGDALAVRVGVGLAVRVGVADGLGVTTVVGLGDGVGGGTVTVIGAVAPVAMTVKLPPSAVALS